MDRADPLAATRPDVLSVGAFSNDPTAAELTGCKPEASSGTVAPYGLPYGAVGTDDGDVTMTPPVSSHGEVTGRWPMQWQHPRQPWTRADHESRYFPARKQRAQHPDLTPQVSGIGSHAGRVPLLGVSHRMIPPQQYHHASVRTEQLATPPGPASPMQVLAWKLESSRRTGSSPQGLMVN